ncbi:MAG: type ISP restriction/modification enzyme [Candidatus Kapaibacterium sp.]
MTLQQYIDSVAKRYASGISREHTYRSDLEVLLRAMVTTVEITNEPANVTDCGNPDYVITKGKIPIGYIEAKDIAKDLNSKSYREQFGRYRNALDNLIITDYLWFQFFQNGEMVHEIRIAEIVDGKVKPLPENFGKFENLIQDFCTFVSQTIKSSKKLAVMMAAKARLLQNILEQAVESDEETQANTSIKAQYETFKDILIHDLDPKGFADIYAQTLAYGMFAARLNDDTIDTFSRQEAAELIPKSNPFLRKLFGYVAGPDIDERIKPTVENLAEVFRHTNVEELLKNFGNSTQTNDPIIHFYETFLAEYDPKLRKSRGVWYTPEPVVSFIVRAVDDILKTEFGLTQGLADTTKTKIKVDVQGKMQEQEVHKVQILDPATGTGTFLAEVVKYIYNTNFKQMQGMWSSYVDEHLIPRLNGFELLMASYAMAHLKLSMLLAETGYKAKSDQRLNVFLTNSLEEHHKDTGTIFSSWLSAESNEANRIKRDVPVMCVIGNPPYSVSSSNKGEWIQNLIKDYKKDLNERKINLDDDYIKFIRYGQHYIEKNGEGILAYISNNSFIDGITHRQMRKNLLETFDKIYILDLHGNSRIKETCSDGTVDQNVFDIMPGVSINIFIKTRNKKKNTLAQVYNSDLLGKREVKYEILMKSSLININWKSIQNEEPYYFFKFKDFAKENKFSLGFKINETFNLSNTGFETAKDNLIIKDDYDTILALKKYIEISTPEEISKKYSISLIKANEVEKDIKNAKCIKALYRPFDYKYTLFSQKSGGVMFRPRFATMKHFYKNNLAVIIGRQGQVIGGNEWNIVTITNTFVDTNIFYRGRGTVFPLYLYPEAGEQATLDQSGSEPQGRTPNLDMKLVVEIAKGLGLEFRDVAGDDVVGSANRDVSFAPLDILDYIYAVLHSPAYREKYKEFLKIDFPRVPYPKDKKKFWQLVNFGSQIRQLHLLETADKYITSYPNDGSNIVERKMTKNSIGYEQTGDGIGRVWINEDQYFDCVPEVAWEFYIGGYQPAQKWLKDRHDRELNFEDINHYQKIIVALTETDRLMKEVDKVGVE